MSGSGRSRRPEGRSSTGTARSCATNRTVCTISVIHSQVTDPEKVIQALVRRRLELEEEEVREKVEKVSSMERIQDKCGQRGRGSDPEYGA